MYRLDRSGSILCHGCKARNWSLKQKKTEMMLAGSSARISSVGCKFADIVGSCILFQTTVTHLGVHLDQTLSMKQLISSLCHTTFLALRRIASIRPFLSVSSIAKFVASMITSGLDYCNATFAGVADEQIAAYKRSRTTLHGSSWKNWSVIMSHRF